MMELEFPNSHASERSVFYVVVHYVPLIITFRYLLLAPRDPDHYHPVYCLEASLYVIVECTSCGSFHSHFTF
jgi:H3 lysine-79-specific histone-lysine N-methyltransferase